MTARLGGLGTGALVSVGCLAQFMCGLSPIGGELEEASAVCGVAGVLGGAGAGVGAEYFPALRPRWPAHAIREPTKAKAPSL